MYPNTATQTDLSEVEKNGPITLLNARTSGVEVSDASHPEVIMENDTFNEGSGDGDTI